MDKKSSAYSLFPPPKSPHSSKSPSRSRRSTERNRRSTSLDPLPPIEDEEPPLPSPPIDPNALKPIHSLHNPRPPSRRNLSDQQTPPPQYQNHFQPPTPEPPPGVNRRHSVQQRPSPVLQQQSYTTAQGPSSPSQMHVPVPTPSTASSLSLQKPPVIVPAKPKSTQPKVVYFHGGLGGRGNYRKVVKKNEEAPVAHAPNVAAPRPGFLQNIFGNGKRRSSPSRDVSQSRSGRGSEESLSEKDDVSTLGVAEAMRQKIVRKIPKSKSNRRNSLENIL